jgi:hypothetical protein
VFKNLKPSANEEERWGDIIGLAEDQSRRSLNAINAAHGKGVKSTHSDNPTAATPGTSAALALPVSQTSLETRQALIYLPPQQRMLNRHAKALARSRDYHVMYHQSWLMAFNEGEKTPPMLITAGKQFDQHHQLEGSLDIQLSRLLHVKTDLWLSSFSESFNGDDTPYSFSDSDDDSRIPSYRPQTESSNYTRYSDNQFKYNTLLANQYDVEQSANLKKHSRLKSNELHYVDHPLMGMLIKINRAEADTDASRE